jgi:hypothetical protein
MKPIFKSLIIVCVSLLFNKSFAQSSDTTMFNRIVNDTNVHSDILLGYCNYDGLKNSIPFKIFWDIEYSSYEIKSQILDSIKTNLSAFTFKIVFGSWCDDSRQNVPRFVKIMQYLDIQEENIQIIAVDKKKKAGIIELEQYYILKVPTMIVYRNGVEIGRIIENPIISLESDLKTILMSY